VTLFDRFFYDSHNTATDALALVTFPWVPIELVPHGFR
jgi:hypothetical protein